MRINQILRDFDGTLTAFHDESHVFVSGTGIIRYLDLRVGSSHGFPMLDQSHTEHACYHDQSQNNHNRNGFDHAATSRTFSALTHITA